MSGEFAGRVTKGGGGGVNGWENDNARTTWMDDYWGILIHAC